MAAWTRRSAGGVNGGAPAAAVAARTYDLDDVGRDGAMMLLRKNPADGSLMVVGVGGVQLHEW